MDLVRDLWGFLRVRKKYWLLPIILTLLFFGALMVFATALAYVLGESGLRVSDLSAVAFYDKPFLKFERLLETYHGFAPRGLRSFIMAMPVWVKEKLMMRTMLKEELAKVGDGNPPVLFPEHHLSHAASAFYPSPFPEAAILTVDGAGEWATSTIGFGRGRGRPT